MNWTPEQSKAIYDSGSNMLISAGAGSGKTAVLTERIYQKVLNGVDVSSLLVLTFTNAAAAEMKERVRKKISKDPSLKSELFKIDNADITTFDSFSLKIVKKYSYYLNLGQNIRIADNGVMALKKKEITKKILDKYYLDNDPRIIDYLNHFTNKEDTPLLEAVFNLYDDLSLLSDTESFINNYSDEYLSNEHLEKVYNEYNDMIMSRLREATEMISIAAREVDSMDEKKISKYEDILTILNSIKEISDLGRLKELKFPKKTNSDTVIQIDYKEKGKDLIKLLKKDIEPKSKDLVIEDILRTKGSISLLLEINNLLIKELDAYKYSEQTFEFIDIAKMAINLVKTYPSIRNELKNQYSEILIDEYQDTSDLQEEFMNLISENNLYMVGDIKQSIYRFRNANPYIFKEKYTDYSNNSGGVKIDLTDNFRSRSEVLSDINGIYNDIMTIEHGDANYRISHNMTYGLKSYSLNQDPSFDYHTRFVTESIPEDREKSPFSKAEKEAFYIANDILNKIDNIKLFSDGTLRKPTYSDFAILIDKGSSFVTIKKILEYKGIPTVINADNDLTSSYILSILNNLLTLLERVYNNNFDNKAYHALTSILRSYLSDYTETEVFEIIKTKNLDNKVINHIRACSNKVDTLSNIELFNLLLKEFRVVELLPIQGDVAKSLIEIEYVSNIISNMSDIGQSIIESSDTLSNILDLNISVKYSLDESSKNAVRIMTIHKSKGLEFPVVYFPTLGNQFNKQEYKSNVIFSKKYGIFHKGYDEGLYNNILYTLIKKDGLEADVSERIRLLYVAVTRTREHMVLFLDPIKKEKTDILSSNSLNDFFSFTTVLNNKEVDYNEFGLTKDYLNNKELIKLNKDNNIIYKSLSRNNKEIVKKRASKTTNSLNDSKINQNIDLGLEFHSALESVDFSNIDISKLPSSDFIKNTLKVLLKNSIFSNIKSAKTYKEHEFTYILDGSRFNGIIDLLVEYNDHIEIIDYKLKATADKEYSKQLLVYKNYVKQKTNKPIKCYLLSILDKEISEIEVE